MSDLTYDDAVAALSGALRFGIHASLDGIRALTDALARPQSSFASVQVTGTNGKTSVTRLLAAIINAHGVRAGTYTSPHLESYTERVEVGGAPVSRESFTRGIEAALDAAYRVSADEGGGFAPPRPRTESGAHAAAGAFTEFELLTAAALWLFREQGADIACLEVGMGGRWDATSVVSPAVSVITGVGLDHTDRLGSTLREIAEDKAHVIKRAAAVVLGPGTLPVADVFLARATRFGLHPRFVAEEGADSPVLDELTVRYRVTDRPTAPGDEVVIDVAGIHATYTGIALCGPSYQAPNMAVAIAAAEAALGRALDPQSVRDAFASASLPGRFELVRRDPPLVLDGAHNPQAAEVLAGAIAEAFGEPGPVVVLGVLADKDADGIVRALSPHASAFVCATPESPRALSAGALADVVRCVTGEAPAAEPDAVAAVRFATRLAGRSGVVVTGSLYMLGQVRAALREAGALLESL